MPRGERSKENIKHTNETVLKELETYLKKTKTLATKSGFCAHLGVSRRYFDANGDHSATTRDHDPIEEITVERMEAIMLEHNLNFVYSNPKTQGFSIFAFSNIHKWRSKSEVEQNTTVNTVNRIVDGLADENK